MKRIVLVLALLGFACTACTSSDKPIEINQLPVEAKTFVDTYFGQETIMLATVDKELSGTSYNVAFESGARIEFDKKGQWKEIDSRSGVPESVFPEPIRTYLNNRYPERRVQGIDRDRNDYEMKLDNGMELKFNRDFQLIEVDD